ncbi:ABC transporter substrate-binding protein [Thauera linaloolentis]|uniref:Iron ABC transporter substrate-binding protein n=1 Tax=Thauera linaloolentis (strain DSM 12138 / JCM 21573 / CCUG 41526 / CIP 105981 / IAM 15112 / NBRC 102519 / 47Lol) TaxID=1123367 RepID=N6YQR0_THAL4|nr:ABC transporter substrate-binding protein [Thauera linaloolentis]ENO84717.1 iron ABC transporter substrate-binding protein [Thauera linaloolentis 47Lol = DSM 12138]MCM8567424.1 ABC transporter substrate-binding protein [Thauera linaloolentis]
MALPSFTASRLAVLIAGLGLSAAALAAPTQYPLTVDNCGQQLKFDKAPEKAVTIGQAGTETFYALGLGDRLAGTSLWFNKVSPEYEAQNAGVERLADNDPSFESVIGKRPGLVAVQFEWMVGQQGVVGTREQFHEVGIPTYILPSDCEGKDNLVGADGTRLQAFDVGSVYKGVLQLAQIFDVQTRGEELVAGYKARLAAAQDKARKNGADKLSALFWFSSADLEIDPYVAGRKGVADFMLASLGMRNVIESQEEWPTVGWETIAKANPDILIIARMERRRFPADDYEKKLEFLKSDSVTRNMDAVKNGRIVIMDADAMQASTRIFAGVEQLAEAAAGFRR